ncbi:MAG: hypothetical protein GWN99_03025 [Gemmatimonadetes bacterium]|uniref:AMP-activated protein kinase glycogen-binding domain-containing protein n=1 Tax=Candidatus Kutchimonas denitrificans TaxID=3056748 RepID=A0AAE4Z7Z7_9BACT|nr:hypothetical protein [Gemmatimonadota bacterium]NIR74929.1 hypothetical protein [Candidatus Kutchimonas denitrificans]NIS00041.1 hypothetical protein [Gemmatimonadota bacterium]NIT65624.1 hypothetical protein [Gemmatimonadota bacterium]NIU52594.1 hypothetical protein [Gemmatimonadota bacterium]
MRPELHAYLDGELAFDELPAELRPEARRWERLLTDAAELGPAAGPVGLEPRILRSLAAARRAPVWRRALGWAVRPRPVAISPLAGLAAAAVLALVLIRPWAEAPEPASEGTTTVHVQFILEAPSARTVAVAGDFTGWSPRLLLQDVDGDGVWAGRFAVAPGVHQYMFVVDDARWVTDPQAERYVDDGFGQRNAVLVVAPPGGGGRLRQGS